MTDHSYLIGKSYRFEDGNSLTIVQIKERNTDDYWVTFESKISPSIPKRTVMPLIEFLELYGHLFSL
jgi:hypothetical protein